MGIKLVALIISLVILLIIIVIVVILIRRRRRGQASPPPDDGPDTQPPGPGGANGPKPVPALDGCNPQPIYRHWNGVYSHADTKNATPGQGWTVDGTLFSLCQSQLPGTIPIYRLLFAFTGDHMISKAASEYEYQLQELLGYAWTSPQPGLNLIPVYRLVGSLANNTYHMTSTNPTENISMFPSVDFGGQPMFYALPPSSAGGS